ncbi:hypothetical protein MSAN_01595200 [Mycena sanguinolenta]|uniref:NACHT domain-containing protein n=1 Tax=Mycena sanguinolenta TaxID=230812 RepID=A0A8H7CXJ2_9AGAR|nr:hypothetical protein MSAN_01595200 [Mycena sanguinolenta]
MSDPSKYSTPSARDKFKDLCKFWETISQGSSPQPSRSTTPAISNRHGSSPDPTAILPSDAGSAPRHADNAEDSLTGGGTTKTDKSKNYAVYVCSTTNAQNYSETQSSTLSVAISKHDTSTIQQAKTVAQSHCKRVHKGADLSTGGHRAKIDKSKTVQSTPETQSGTISISKHDTSAIQPAKTITWSNCKRADNAEEVLKGGHTTKTNKSGSTKPAGRTYYVNAFGGTGGAGGSGGARGGRGGTGKGPEFNIKDSNVHVTDPEATALWSIEKKLTGNVATQYKFTDQSKSLCAPGTRVKIQATILKWLSPEPGTRRRIFWITGIAGSGKSTLSATIVDKLRERGMPVAAQFFISRNIPETIAPTKLVPTIALQLASFSPTAASIIEAALKDSLPGTQEEQIKELLLAPIWELSKSCDLVIIVIDALDELLNAAKSVPEILSKVTPLGCDLPDNVRFLITSRPEHWADISRSKSLNLKVFKQHPLMTESSVVEVHNFIVERMQEITPNEPGWENWPDPKELQTLSDKANGLFHYAATALHWIEDQICNNGKACQNTVFAQFTLLGIGALEALYMVILTSFEDIAEDLNKTRDKQAQGLLKRQRKNRLCGFQHVIGTILVLEQPLTISQIIALLANVPNFDVGHFLWHMRSILVPGTATSFEEATPQMHKSFRDYIMDGHAPAEFHIHMGHAHFGTAKSCLEVIVKAGDQSDIDVRYPVKHWAEHLRMAVEGGATWEDERIWNLLGLMVEEAVFNIWEE